MWKAITICLVLLYSAEAAKHMRARDVVTAFMAKRSVDAPRPTVREVLQLTPDEDIESQKTLMTVRGSLKTRYEETYKGVPVYGSVITADDQDPSDVEGTFVQEIEQDLSDVTPELSARNALEIAQNLEGDIEVANEEAKLYIYNHEGKARLIYETNYLSETDEKVSRPFHMIDAKTGEVIDSWEGIENHQMAGHGGNTKIGHYKYGTDYPHLDTTSSDGKNCVLENKNVRVIHMNFGTTGSQSHSVDCSKGATDEINGAKSPANDALYFGGVVFNMFKDWYNTAPLTMSLTMRVHYKTKYENAFWDGRQMTFGDGATRFHPLVCLDVTAHEVSHGFTQQNSNLRYKYQSGGMNEAFSDMSGETAEYFSRGSNDWKMGYDIFKAAGKALRYMDDPEKDGRSISHASKYHSGMDVHFSSGVYNKMFYLLATTPGWTPRKAFEIMVRANQLYWGKDTTFDQGAEGVYKAAMDLGYPGEPIKKAFVAVGVKEPGGSTLPTNTDSPPTTPPPPTDGPAPPTQPPVPPGKAEPIYRAKFNLQAKAGSGLHYYIEVKSSILYVRTFRGSGNPDLYVKRGSLASTTDYDYKATKDGNDSLYLLNVSRGTYYIYVHAAGQDFKGVAVQAVSI